MPLAFLPATSLDLGTKGFAFALEQSHLPGLLIAGILLVLSILSWSVMASKIALMSRASQRNYRFAYAFRKAKEPLELHDKGLNLPGSPLFSVYRAGSRELTLYLEQSIGNEVHTPGGQIQARNARRITPDQMEAVRNVMDRCIGEAVLTFENRMNMLATAVSGAPFLGLLGTVWGVMETFSGIASTSSTANIRDMAPGVAAALVTTVIGLLVAIPAMFGYNFLVNRIRTSTLEMHNFASELAALFERDYVDFRPSPALSYPASAAAPSPAPQPPYYNPLQDPVTPIPPAPFPGQIYHVPPSPGPLEVTAPVPLQVTAPVPTIQHRHQEAYPSMGSAALEPDAPWEQTGPTPINPIAQQAAYQSQWEQERQRDRQQPARPPVPLNRPGNRPA